MWFFRDQQAQSHFRPFRSDLATLVSLLQFIPVNSDIGLIFTQLRSALSIHTPLYVPILDEKAIKKNL